MEQIFKLYALDNYGKGYGEFIKKGYIEIEGIEEVCKELAEDKYYHFRVLNNTTYTFFGDLDELHISIEEYIVILQNFMLNSYGLSFEKNDFKYTQNNVNGTKYHFSIPKFNCLTEKLKEIFTNFLNEYPVFKKHPDTKSAIQDTSIYSDHWFRCPNQSKGDKKKRNQHVIIKGNMKNFIIDYIPKKSIDINDYEYKKKIVKPEKKEKEKKIKKEEKIKNEKEEIKEDGIIVKNENIIIETPVKENNDIENTELYQYLELCLKNKVFENFPNKGCYEKWLHIGLIIKNAFGEKGFDIFNKVSKQMPNYDGDEKNFNFYDYLNKIIKNDDKKKLTIATLQLYVKEFIDEDLYKEINKKFLKLKKKTNVTYTFDDEKCNNFNTEYFNTLTNYPQKKQYFENFCCKIYRPSPCYMYRETDTGKINTLIYEEDEIVKTFKHLKSGILKNNIETAFIKEWIGDENLLHYNQMDFIPFNGTINGIKTQHDKITFNLFNGYSEHIHTEYDKTKKEEILKPFKDLLYELCGAEDRNYNYFYNYLSQIIQQPREKVQYAFIFKSKEGVGKNVMLNAISNIIGNAHYISTSKIDDIFGTYSEGFYKKIIINLNELDGKDSILHEGHIKSFITENTIIINPKQVRPAEINNYARLIIFSNKSTPIKIDPTVGDRRWIVFQSTEKYLNKDYGYIFWSKLVSYFKNPKFIACLYDDLNNNDISKMEWSKRPITKAYIELCNNNIPTEALFLEHFIENKIYENFEDFNEDEKKQFNFSTTMLYNYYVSFCTEFGYKKDDKFLNSINKFNCKMCELELGIIKIKTSKFSALKFCIDDVYKIMVKKNWCLSNRTELCIADLENTDGKDFKDYFTDL